MNETEIGAEPQEEVQLQIERRDASEILQAQVPELSVEDVKKNEAQAQLLLRKITRPEDVAGETIPIGNYSKSSGSIIQKLRGTEPFMATAEAYGKAIAESILMEKRTEVGRRLNFDDTKRTRVEFKSGSYALVYKGRLPVRLAPFVWSLDQGTRRKWAVFTFDDFYGHAYSMKPWKRLTTPIVLTPFDDSSNLVDNYGKGYLIKMDEATQFQMPLHVQDTAEAELMRVDNRNFISAALTLWMDLQAYTKAKANMKLIIAIALIAVVIVLLYLFWPMISGMLGNIFPKAG